MIKPRVLHRSHMLCVDSMVNVKVVALRERKEAINNYYTTSVLSVANLIAVISTL